MKVAFPTNRGDKIAKHSSFCQSFLVVDTQSGTRFTLANPVKEAAEHTEASTRRGLGKGRAVIALLADAGVDACVCNEAKAPFAQRLAEAGIAPYIVEERQIERVLEALASQKIAPQMPEQGSGTGRHNGSGRGRGMRSVSGGGRSRSRGFGRGMDAKQRGGRAFGMQQGGC